jgi:hypothetical protein
VLPAEVSIRVPSTSAELSHATHFMLQISFKK